LRSNKLLTKKKGISEAKKAVNEYTPVMEKCVPLTMRMPNPRPGVIRQRNEL
jgi:hypothetical protein